VGVLQAEASKIDRPMIESFMTVPPLGFSGGTRLRRWGALPVPHPTEGTKAAAENFSTSSRE
jgi:hypothetical protein